MGEHLRDIGMKPVIVGKTHMVPNTKGKECLGIDPESIIGIHLSEIGLGPFDRDDGLHPDNDYAPEPTYSQRLRDAGLNPPNPKDENAYSGLDEDGQRLSGWLPKNSSQPADIRKELPETLYMTTRAMAFMDQEGDQPWLCHLSSIEPHWLVPAPYQDMYGPEHVVTPVRSDAEKENLHRCSRPVWNAGSAGFSRTTRYVSGVTPAHMALIKLIDGQMGRLFAWMKDPGLWEITMTVLTSHHRDNLGDHWMGGKDPLHDQSVRMPLIVYDPVPAVEATRGTVCDAQVEAIGLPPTFQAFFRGPVRPHIYDGSIRFRCGMGKGWTDATTRSRITTMPPARRARSSAMRRTRRNCG